MKSWGVGIRLTETYVRFEFCALIPVFSSVISSLVTNTNYNIGDETKIDRKIYLGSPLSIQVVAPKLQEYRLFRAMEIIDKVLHPESGSTTAKAKL